jgi:hypothetical protein
MTRPFVWTLPWLMTLAVLAAGGCSRQNLTFGEVEGTVKRNGKALANVIVQFLPDPEKNTLGPQSAGVTDEHGHYRLQSDLQQGGAVVGWHRVLLQDAQAQRLAQGQAPRSAPRLPASYSNSNETPFKFEVKSGTQTIDLEVSAALTK